MFAYVIAIGETVGYSTIRYLLTTFFLTGFYHSWYILAIIYTVLLVFVFNKFKSGIKILYVISFVFLLTGILMFGYGNLFFKIPIMSTVFGVLDTNINMQIQWLFSVLPFFMMKYGFSNYNPNKKVYVIAEFLLILSVTGYFVEVVLIQFANYKASTTLCLFTYSIIYLLLLISFKHPHVGNRKIATYSADLVPKR